MSRERLLLLFGPEGVEELTNRARASVAAVDGCYAHSVVDEAVVAGKKLGVLPSNIEPLPLVRKARGTLALEEEKIIMVDSVEAFLREQQNKNNQHG